MSEETDQPPPPEKKKRKVGFRLKMALLEVIERKQLTDRVDYKAIAARHGISADNARQLYKEWKAGRIDLGDPMTPEERQIDARMQHEKMLELLKRYQALVLKGFEGLLFTAEDEMTTAADSLAWQRLGLPACIKELRTIMEIRSRAEEGYNAVLEEEVNRRRSEKTLPPTIPAQVQTKIITANDAAKAREALLNGSGISPQTTAGVPSQDGTGTGTPPVE